MAALTDKQREQLNADLPGSAVASREGGGGKTLSYLEGWYVIDRLNEILGPGNWSYDVVASLACSREVVKRKKTGEPYRTDHEGKPVPSYLVTYTAKCVLRVGDAVIGDYGAGHGDDFAEGIAHESAIKEAATDAFKRAAKSLGRSVGLALYDREQEHVLTPREEFARWIEDNATRLKTLPDSHYEWEKIAKRAESVGVPWAKVTAKIAEVAKAAEGQER